MKHKKLTRGLILLILLALFITYPMSWLLHGQAGTASASITFSFSGIGKGLDPKGNRFDINEIKRESVLDAAIQKAGFQDRLTGKELSANLTITPVVSRNALTEIIKLSNVTGKTETVAENIVYPSQYVIGLKDMGLPSILEQKKLLQSILEAYQEYLKKSYLLDVETEPAYSQQQIMQLDYPDMASVLYREADTLVRYASTFMTNTERFVSQEKGLAFSDLYEQSITIRDTDINNIRNVVDYFVLTRDISQRIKYEETLLKRANLSVSKANGRQWTLSDITTMYDNSDNYVMASGDMNATQFSSQSNEYYDQLTNQLMESKAGVINAKYDVLEIQKRITKLQAADLGSFEYQNKIAETMADVESASKRLTSIRTQIRTLAEEYYDLNIGSKITVSKVGYRFHAFGNPLLNLALLLALVALAILLNRWVREKGYLQYLKLIKEKNHEQRKRAAKEIQ